MFHCCLLFYAASSSEEVSSVSSVPLSNDESSEPGPFEMSSDSDASFSAYSACCCSYSS
ncbi:hypothetical protein L6D11_14750 [Staphylococcus aureus]|nr:hypothetical protein [Staphylococcus aureus]